MTRFSLYLAVFFGLNLGATFAALPKPWSLYLTLVVSVTLAVLMFREQRKDAA